MHYFSIKTNAQFVSGVVFGVKFTIPRKVKKIYHTSICENTIGTDNSTFEEKLQNDEKERFLNEI